MRGWARTKTRQKDRQLKPVHMADAWVSCWVDGAPFMWWDSQANAWANCWMDWVVIGWGVRVPNRTKQSTLVTCNPFI